MKMRSENKIAKYGARTLAITILTAMMLATVPSQAGAANVIQAKNEGKVTMGNSVCVAGQKATVNGVTHSHPDTNTYTAYLYNNSNCKNSIAKGTSKSRITFEELNPGQNYYFKVCESKTNGNSTIEYMDTARIFKLKGGYANIAIYNSQKSVENSLLKAAKAREKKLTFYYPANQSIKYFNGGNALLDTKNGGIAYTWIDEKGLKNKYGEKITINGKAHYKYQIGLNYEYSKAKQEKYLNKINSLKSKLTGSSANRVKKMNNYFINKCKYDYSLKNYSVYSALVDGKSGCDGYARAASVVLNMAGVKCEAVSGKAKGSKGWNGHTWNIVKVGKKWYSCDFAWNMTTKGKTKYLLKGTKDKTFNNYHKIGSSYKTKVWQKAHPMAAGNY